MPGLEEDPYFITILDQVDPYKAFLETMGGLPGDLQQALVQSLGPEKAALDALFQAATKQAPAPGF